jgi:hypothetical protein
MFKSHLIKSNHIVLRKNKVDTYGAPVLYLIVSPLFCQPKCVKTPMSIVFMRFLWVEHSPHIPKIKGLSPAATEGTGIKRKVNPWTENCKLLFLCLIQRQQDSNSRI